MEEEEALVRSFIVPAKRERYVELLSNRTRRAKITRGLAHLRDLDPHWIVESVGTLAGSIEVEAALLRLGANETCYLISENPRLDGRRFPLRDALDEVIGSGMGTLISCVPGVLAYYEGEVSHRCILHRPSSSRPGAHVMRARS